MVQGSRGNAELNLRGLTIVALTGAWLLGIFLASLYSLSPGLLLGVASGALLLALLLRQQLNARMALMLLFCLILGAWRSTTTLPTNDPLSIAKHISPQVIQVQGMISDEPKLAGQTRLLKIAVSGINTHGGFQWDAAHGTIEVQTLGTLLEETYGANYGDVVTLQGKLMAPQPHSPPEMVAEMAFPRVSVTQHGGNPVIALLYHWRVHFATLLAQTLPQPLAALLIAVLLGLRTPQLAPLLPAFNVTGTAHLIVPSGFKVTILAGIVTSCTRWLYAGQENPGNSRRSWQRWLSMLISLLCISAYTILSGAGPAAIRSGVMGGLLVLAPRLGRTYNIYTALAFTALGMSILDPTVIWETGFQLSFLGTLGIVLLTPYIQRLLRPLEHIPGGHVLAETSAVTLAAQIATFPIFAIAFQQISFIAPLANMLTVPLLGILITLGMLICLLGQLFLPLGIVCAWVAWPVLWYMSQSILWCAALPGAYISVNNVDGELAWLYYLPLTFLIIVLLRRWPVLAANDTPLKGYKQNKPTFILSKRGQRWLYTGLVLIMITTTGLASLQSSASGQFSVTFLGVGPAKKPLQGEAIFVRTADNQTLLIDGGIDATSLSQALDSRLPFWQRSLDMVMLTSPRTDHLRGLQDIVMRYSVGTILDAGMLHPSAAYASWRSGMTARRQHYQPVVQGQTIALGKQTQIQILWPTTQLHTSSNEVRDNSLIVRLVTPGFRLLLLGETAQSHYALTHLQNPTSTPLLQADIIQIIGETGQPLLSELKGMVTNIHPTLLIITPPTTHYPKGATPTNMQTNSLSCAHLATRCLQTGQIGDLEIIATISGWKINSS